MKTVTRIVLVVLALLASPVWLAKAALPPTTITSNPTILNPDGEKAGKYQINFGPTAAPTEFELKVISPSWDWEAGPALYGSPLELGMPSLSAGEMKSLGELHSDPPPWGCFRGAFRVESRYKINLPPNTDAVFELPYLLSAIPYAKTPIISKIEVVDPIQPTEGQTLISPISVTRSVAWFDVKKKGALKRSDEIEVVAGKRLRLVGRTRPKRSGKIVAEIIEPFTGKVLSHMSSRAGRNGWFLLDAERKVRPRGAYTLRMKWKNQPASGWKCVTGVRALKP